MKKVLLFAMAILLVGSVCTVASAYDGDKKTGDQKNIVIRIKGDATEADGEEWLYVGSGDDDEKEIKELKVKKKSCSAYLGIYMDELSAKIKRKHNYPKDNGVLIIDVVTDSPAEAAGLEENDIIYLFGGEEVDNAKHLSAFVRDRKPGDSVDIVLYRGGDKKQIKVVLGEYTGEVSVDVEDFNDYVEEIGDFAGRLGKSFGTWWQGSFGSGGRLGIELTNLDGDLAGYFDVEGGEGVLVLKVIENSPAEEAGVKAGDVIVAFNGEAVSEVNDVIEGLADLDEKTVEIEIVRKGKKQTLNVEIDEGEHIYRIRPEGRQRIVIPPAKRFDIIDKAELDKELEELRKELKELKKQLKEMEKD